jgi:uncharacterized protein (DUF4415 family)
MSAVEESIEEDEELSFTPKPSPEEARARLAALRGKPLDAPSRLAVVSVEEPAEVATPTAPAQPDLAATVAALVAESLKQLRPAEAAKAEPQKAAKADKPLFKAVKVRITTRVDADVLEAFKATGPGWQTLMNDVLRANMPSSPPPTASD